MRLLRLRAMSDSDSEAARSSVAAESLSYDAGILHGAAPRGMSDDRLDMVLGSGDEVWSQARRALDQWVQFDLGWTAVATGGSTPHPGLDVLVKARRLGIRMFVASRIIETHDVVGSGRHRYGFTYGTLLSHIARGEELFEVWLDLATKEVGYTIHAMAGPGRWYSRLARPLVDYYRGVFCRDSAAAMAMSVAR